LLVEHEQEIVNRVKERGKILFAFAQGLLDALAFGNLLVGAHEGVPQGLERPMRYAADRAEENGMDKSLH